MCGYVGKSKLSGKSFFYNLMLWSVLILYVSNTPSFKAIYVSAVANYPEAINGETTCAPDEQSNGCTSLQSRLLVVTVKGLCSIGYFSIQGVPGMKLPSNSLQYMFGERKYVSPFVTPKIKTVVYRVHETSTRNLGTKKRGHIDT